MQVKFDFESIRKHVTFNEFDAELREFCNTILTPDFSGAVAWESDRLYKEKAFVYLTHEWANYSHALDGLIKDGITDGAFYDAIHSDYDHLSFIIADML